MPSPFSKKNVPAGVQEEIRARGSKQGIQWAAKRFPWIHITSLSSGCEDQRYQNLTSIRGGFLYQDDYARPYPVVTQVDVKKQGELGTTRKATANIIAFTDQQLAELSKCYFIPGMGIRLEWGWSESAVGSGNPPVLGNRELSDAQAICEMNKRSEQYTNYCGLQGLVTNFTYNYNQNGYWDCSMELVGAAEPFAGTKIGEYGCDCAREYENEDPQTGETKPAVSKKGTLYTFFKDVFENNFTSYKTYSPTLIEVAAQSGQQTAYGMYNYNGPARTEKGGDDSAWYEGSFLGVTVNQPDTLEFYISWSTLEAAINAYTIPTADGKYVLGKIASKQMLLKAHPKVESADPRVCIIPGSKKASTTARLFAGNPRNAINGDYVILDNMMINCVFLMNELRQVEEQQGTIYGFLTNVLRKINDACGNLWEFEVAATTEDCLDPKQVPTLSVIDAKIYEAGETFSVPALPLANVQSVLRDLKLDMKMTDQMKTQALYSNAGQTKTKTDSGGGCGSNGFAPFGMKGDEGYRNLAAPKALTPPKCDCENASPDEPPEQPTFDELFEKLGDDVTEDSVSAAKSALVAEYASSIEKGDDQHCVGMPLPFEFSFTLDGIGGFVFGQIVSCDRIPPKVRDAYDFQVTAVEHSITVNDWTTTVNTVCRFKGKQ